MKEPLGNSWVAFEFQINQDRDTKGTSFLWENIITSLLLTSLVYVHFLKTLAT